MKTGKDMLETIIGHPSKRECPRCKKDISRTALVRLVYAFEECSCDKAPYIHLIETVYHRECYAREAFLMTPEAT